MATIKVTGTAVYPHAEFVDRLDALVEAARQAGVPARQIATTLTERANSLALVHALTAPAGVSGF
jgi:hypothetical protein